MSSNKIEVRDVNSSRGMSPAIWADCPKDEMVTDNSVGYFFMDDFLVVGDPTTATCSGNYLMLDTGDSTITASPEVGGAIKLLVTTDNEDVGIKLGDATSAAFVIPAASSSGKKLWFEACIKKSVITNAYGGCFVGLADETALAANFIADAGADFADNDLLGFWVDETDDTLGSHAHVVCQKTGAAFDTIIDTAATLVADTYIKLGFVYDPEAPVTKRIKFFVDGVEQGTYVGEGSADATVYITDTTNFPGGEEMNPIAYVSAASGNDLSMYMDWWACAQLR